MPNSIKRIYLLCFSLLSLNLLPLLMPYRVIGQTLSIKEIDIPDSYKEIMVSKNRIYEDINQDGLLDIVLISKRNILIYYYESGSEIPRISEVAFPSGGAVDFADIFEGGEKEILLMNSQGISYLESNAGHWQKAFVPLLPIKTIFEDSDSGSLIIARYAIDIDRDDVPELLVMNSNTLGLFRKTKEGRYQLAQTLPVASRSFLDPPGLEYSPTLFSRRAPQGLQFSYLRKWPIKLRILEWTRRIKWEDIIIGDIDKDRVMEMVRIEHDTNRLTGLKKSGYYRYSIFGLLGNGKYATEPMRIVRDPFGVWLSESATEIQGEGAKDLLKINIIREGGLLQKPQIRLETILEPISGDYPAEPFQTMEVSDYPLGGDPLTDINRDGFKDLVLVHPVTRGFSVGNIIRKYVEKSIDIELRILLFRKGKGWIREGAFTKRLSISYFAGIPISLAGDFDGDGNNDILTISGDTLRIYVFKQKENAASLWFKTAVNQSLNGPYEITDLDHDRRSEIIFFMADKISIITILSRRDD